MKRQENSLPLGVKRVFDIAIAALFLLLSAPLTAFIAILIMLDDGWPVYFVQERIGLGARRFRCLKFRTMKVGSSAQGDALNVSADDQRLTRIGNLLRQWTLDEIPQLVNVIKGEMSIVGPRPWVAEQADLCNAAQQRRFAMRPGMAGWAWIHGRNQLPFDERIRLDLWYIDNWNLWLDLKILGIAFVQLFRRIGVFAPVEINKQLDLTIVNGNHPNRSRR